MNTMFTGISTSNFAVHGKYERALAISRTVPGWYKGDRYTKLAPSAELLGTYKRGRIGDEEYAEIYNREVLDALDAETVVGEMEWIYVDRLPRWQQACSEEIAKTPIILLCWCAKGAFCHRRLVAGWLEREMDIEVKEA